MEFVEPEDESPRFRKPPLPDDRIWRHPSEVGPPAAAAPPRSRPDRSMWLVACISAVGASLLTMGLVLVAGGLGENSTSSGGTVEKQMVAGPRAETPIVELADQVRPGIVQLRVQTGDRGATGSGVIFRSDGHVLTNAHVVGGADAIEAVLHNGRRLPARLIGSDPVTETAVVKIDGGPFPVATLGTAVNLKVGQTAIAVGSPLGLAGGPSVTVGVISGLHREVNPRGTDQPLVDMVQTDAPIAAGSSGGALLDDDGAVIGITTAVALGDVGGEGLGFAIPIDVARLVAEQLITTGKAVHVWIGVEGSDLDAKTAGELRVDGGAMVGQVKPNSPAQRSGLTARDVIVGVDGKTVRSMGELVVTLRGHRPGDTVEIELVRERQRVTVKVALAERPPT
ncbi:MAG: S1C family serine protease [Actinomycetota bacterium]|nr:S1C family serine protease [Actinomycetota bacterium]